MTEHYPLPAYAASIWFTGTGIAIAFEAQGPEAKGSTIHIPLDRCGIEVSNSGAPLPSQRGWAVLLNALKQRYMAVREFKKLGQRGTPTQYEVERALANDARFGEILGAMKRAQEVDEEAKAQALRELEELGL